MSGVVVVDHDRLAVDFLDSGMVIILVLEGVKLGYCGEDGHVVT